jgi:hypothetical protein
MLTALWVCYLGGWIFTCNDYVQNVDISEIAIDMAEDRGDDAVILVSLFFVFTFAFLGFAWIPVLLCRSFSLLKRK